MPAIYQSSSSLPALYYLRAVQPRPIDVKRFLKALPHKSAAGSQRALKRMRLVISPSEINKPCQERQANTSYSLP